MRRVPLTAVALLVCLPAVLIAATSQELAISLRSCLKTAATLKTLGQMRDRLNTTCVPLADQLVTALAPPPPPPPPPVAPPPPPPPPAAPVYGPQAAITCPAGAVFIAAGASIQGAVNTYPAVTSFCLGAGIHPVTAAITPKTGDTFTGEYGAILDGTGWISPDTSQAAFRANNQDIDDVTVRNLTVRNMPQKGIHVFGVADRWVLEAVEVAATPRGIELGNGGTLRKSFVHDNTTGGLTCYQCSGAVVEDNEFARNGRETKFVGTHNVTFQRNFVHHSLVNGVWFDTSNVGALVQNNVVEDSTESGIEFEISGRDSMGVNGANLVRWNTVRRSGSACILIATSANTEVYENTCEGNFRGIQYFLNTAAIQWLASPRTQDLRDNYVHDNVITVGTQPGAWANAFSHSATTDNFALAPYLSGAQNNRFEHNTYHLPNLTTAYFRWGTSSAKTFPQWQALPQDATGTAVTP